MTSKGKQKTKVSKSEKRAERIKMGVRDSINQLRAGSVNAENVDGNEPLAQVEGVENFQTGGTRRPAAEPPRVKNPENEILYGDKKIAPNDRHDVSPHDWSTRRDERAAQQFSQPEEGNKGD